MCATAAIAVAILLFSEFDETAGRILGTTGALAFYSLLALPAGVLLDRGRVRRLAWTTLALAAIGLMLTLALLWLGGDDDPETLVKSALTACVFAVAAAYASATASRIRDEDPRLVRALFAAGVAVALVLACLSTLAAWAEIDDVGYYRVFGALAVVGVLLTLLQPVARKTAAPRSSQTGGFRLRLILDDGRRIEGEEAGADFADAVARAIRATERDGSRVQGIERLEAGPGAS
jgi:MFS family permease